MREIIYPKKLDVPSTAGNIFDLMEFFCHRRNTRSIARKALEKCRKLNYN